MRVPGEPGAPRCYAAAMSAPPPDWNPRRPPQAPRPGAPRRAPTLSGMIAAWLLIGGVVYLAVLNFVPGLRAPRIAGGSHGELVLHAGRGGNYQVAGSINDVPVRFIVDTGASTVAVSRAMAEDMHIQGCMAGLGSTANGNVPVCMATARSVRFGPFEARDVQVVVLPRLQGQALLGMNVLRELHITQSGGRMVLTAPHQ